MLLVTAVTSYACDCSPHLLTLRERISIDGRPIASTDFDGLASAGVSAAQAALGDNYSNVTHFEMVTALALRHFQQQKVNPACCHCNCHFLALQVHLYDALCAPLHGDVRITEAK